MNSIKLSKTGIPNYIINRAMFWKLNGLEHFLYLLQTNVSFSSCNRKFLSCQISFSYYIAAVAFLFDSITTLLTLEEWLLPKVAT